jgi:murein DD-endopeptidase MepM/ murein hydrolase activator NlpD
MSPVGTSRFASRRAVRAFSGATMVGVFLASGLAPGMAKDDLKDDKRAADTAVADAHDDVVKVSNRVKVATEKALFAEGKLPVAQAELAQSQEAQVAATQASASAQADLAQAQEDIKAAQAHLNRIEGDIADLSGEVGNFVRRAYQMGPFAELELLLDAKDPSDFTHRLAAIRSVTRSSGQALTDMAEDRADLDFGKYQLQALRSLAVTQAEVARTRVDAAQQAANQAAVAKKEVDDLVALRQEGLDIAKANKVEIKAAYDDLAAEQARIAAEIAEAVRRAEAKAARQAAAREAERKAAARREREKQAKDKSGNSAGSGNTGNSGGGSGGSSNNGSGGNSGGGGGSYSSGSWVFPVSGAAIGSEAGWRLHPILGYTRCHAGADIGAGSGTPIRAVSDGEVISAGWNGGYGNYTTISHGNGLTSSYAHQSSMGVSSGQWVNRGQVIGYVGSTGLSSGPHLHFEARIYGQPHNPRGWFGTGSKNAVCT